VRDQQKAAERRAARGVREEGRRGPRGAGQGRGLTGARPHPLRPNPATEAGLRLLDRQGRQGRQGLLFSGPPALDRGARPSSGAGRSLANRRAAVANRCP
jgi:hypothetical protein